MAVKATPRPFYPQEKRPGTHCTGGWVGPRAGLDECEKSRLSPGFDPWNVQPATSIKYAIPERTEHIANGCFTDFTT